MCVVDTCTIYGSEKESSLIKGGSVTNEFESEAGHWVDLPCVAGNKKNHD